MDSASREKSYDSLRIKFADIAEKIDDIPIITDLKMPKIDGMNFIKLVRERNKDIPIIIITAYGSEKNRVLAENFPDRG